MISLTRTAQAVVSASLHGRGRAADSNQVMIVSRTRWMSVFATAGNGESGREDLDSAEARCVIWMLKRFGLGSKR